MVDGRRDWAPQRVLEEYGERFLDFVKVV